MRDRRSWSRSVAPLACAGAVSILILIAGCTKPAPAVVDAGPAPVATDAAPAILVPLEVDAGNDIDASDSGPRKHGGGGLSTNQAHAKQCCNDLRKQAASDPLLLSLANQCDAIAMQMGPTSGGQAPEFAPLRQFLKGKTMPAICQGL